jgi:hypothetical protein
MQRAFVGYAWISIMMGLAQIADGLLNLVGRQPDCAATAFGFLEIAWASVSALVATVLLFSGQRRLIWWPATFVAYTGFGIAHGIALVVEQGSALTALDIPRWAWVVETVFGVFFAAASLICLSVIRKQDHVDGPRPTTNA